MEVTTRGRFRVLDSPRKPAELLLIDVRTGGGTAAAADAVEPDFEEAYAPTYLTAEGYEGPLAATVGALRPGYLVEATLAWTDGTPRFADIDLERRTLVEFVDGVTGIFEAARGTWREAEAAGEAMNSRVTRSTDGDPNGVLYTFAEQRGARDLFGEFRSGVLPLEPLLKRVNRTDDGSAGDEGGRAPAEREVFVMRPADEPFVLVYIVLRKEGLLADTVRSTYDCPRPDEAPA